VAVLVCAWWMQLQIPLLPLLLGIGLLAVFSVFAAWRLSQPWPVREWETIGHIAADTLVLGYLLYFTGGASNPFITLLLVPIALERRGAVGTRDLAVSALAGVAYLICCAGTCRCRCRCTTNAWRPDAACGRHGRELRDQRAAAGLLHQSAGARAACAAAEVQRVRERALRDEGILAIATQAAGAAHELNTPLSTMRTLLPELRRDMPAMRSWPKIWLLEGQVDRCRTILREMVAFGKAQLSQESGTAHRGAVHPRLPGALPVAATRGGLDPGAGRQHRIAHACARRLACAMHCSICSTTRPMLRPVAIRRWWHCRCTRHRWLQLSVRDRRPRLCGDGELALLGAVAKTGRPWHWPGAGRGHRRAPQWRTDRRNTEHGAEMCLRLPLAVIADR
jgi:two-component system sensor histidine kinase RegB